jgi:hypothetical protein
MWHTSGPRPGHLEVPAPGPLENGLLEPANVGWGTHPANARRLPRTFGACAAAAPTPEALPSKHAASLRRDRRYHGTTRCLLRYASGSDTHLARAGRTKSDTRSLERGVRLVTSLVRQTTIKGACDPGTVI